MKDKLIKIIKEKYNITRELTEDEENIIVHCLDIINALNNEKIELEKEIYHLEIIIKNKSIIIEDMLDDAKYRDDNG